MLEPISAALTGDFSSCPMFSVDVMSANANLAHWAGGAQNATALPAEFGPGISTTITFGDNIQMIAECTGGSVPTFQLTITIQWTHAVPTRTIT